MKRYTPKAQEEMYDLVIVGGGIYGAAMVFSSTLNGIKTLLVEKDDFSANTSSNSQKVIHGGLRYLQHFDIKRVVESIREKQRFYCLFPHMVKPLPCILPISSGGIKGRMAFRIALFIYKLIQKTICKGDLKKHLDKQPRLLSEKEMTRQFPHLLNASIRGGALWYDGICTEPERVIISLLQKAENLGARLGNYMKVKSIQRIDASTIMVGIHDRNKNRCFQVRTKKVAICSGSWFGDDIGPEKVPDDLQKLTLIRGMNLILPSLFPAPSSLAVKTNDTMDSRFLFIVPWKNYSIGGTYWEECPDPKVPWYAEKQTVVNFHNQIQKTLCDEANKSRVLFWHVGYVPGIINKGRRKSAENKILSHYKIIDRETQQRGDVLQVVGVKFTTAFDVVCKALERLFPDKTISDVLTFQILPYGSTQNDVDQEEAYFQERYQDKISHDQCHYIFALFGNALPTIVTNYLTPHREAIDSLSDIEIYCGLTKYCVKKEMALHLKDLVFRRLFPNSPEVLPRELLSKLAQTMLELLDWTAIQKESEIEEAIEQWQTKRLPKY